MSMASRAIAANILVSAAFIHASAELENAPADTDGLALKVRSDFEPSQSWKDAAVSLHDAMSDHIIEELSVEWDGDERVQHDPWWKDAENDPELWTKRVAAAMAAALRSNGVIDLGDFTGRFIVAAVIEDRASRLHLP